MRTESIKKSKVRIRTFFKELINVHKAKNYKEEIVQSKPTDIGVPTFQLRFIKQGEECKYYRIMLNDVDIN